MGDSDFEETFGAQFGAFAESAAALKEMFDTYVGVGFSEEQALQICLTQLAIVGSNHRHDGH